MVLDLTFRLSKHLFCLDRESCVYIQYTVHMISLFAGVQVHVVEWALPPRMKYTKRENWCGEKDLIRLHALGDLGHLGDGKKFQKARCKRSSTSVTSVCSLVMRSVLFQHWRTLEAVVLPSSMEFLKQCLSERFLDSF